MSNNLVFHDFFHGSFFPQRWNNFFPRRWNDHSQRSCDYSYNTKAYEIREKDDEYQIDLDIPGVSKDDLKIEVKEKQLHIHTDYVEEAEKEQERRTYDFSFSIPENVVEENIHIELKQGVLRIGLPKREKEKPKQLEITEVA